jgi:lipopolysaccharide/colanic/teichoic acid biosynthesis glycosyltransferase
MGDLQTPALSLGEEREGGSTVYEAAKRAMDLVLAAVGLIASLPALALLAAIILIDWGGPILVRQPRVGRRGREFGMWKLRTMRGGADAALEQVFQDDPGLRLTWELTQKLYRDPRLTRVGSWLRRFSLDELPQLWNVVLGEMSLVGPRPILPTQIEAYGEAIAEYIQVRPGMTGLWQVRGRNLLSFAERVELDRDYLRRRSWRLDLWILTRTVWVAVQGVGAF